MNEQAFEAFEMILAEKMRTIFTIIARNNLNLLCNAFFRRFYSNSCAIGLRRDLKVKFITPDANIPIKMRRLEQHDADELLNTKTPELNIEGVHMRLSRSQLLSAGIPQCYVAVTEDGSPCYMQWLFSSKENRRLRKYYRGYFPELAGDEALLEGAFTPEHFRGQRIMPHAMSEIALKAAALGARWVLTFVDDKNVPSLKGCQRAGFSPYLVREERWRLFHRLVKFYPMPHSTRAQVGAKPKTASATVA